MKDKVALITGGATGVGKATALALAKLGCRIGIVYSKSKDDARETIHTLRNLGVHSEMYQADVADDAAVKRAVTMLSEKYGRIDVLVNCAGTTEFVAFPNLDAVTDEAWDRLFRVNVVGAFHCARAVRPIMDQNGGGVIINVSSVAAQIAQGSSIPYCASKAALDNLTVSLARTFAPTIRVNGVAPGFITGRWLETGLGGAYEKVKQAFEGSLPLGRVCDPEDVAAAIVSLITGSPLVTGQTLAVDSGMLISGFQAKFK